MTLPEGAVVDITAAEYAGGYRLRLSFSDDTARTVDFEPFLSKSHHPMIRKYLDLKEFADFSVRYGDLVWHDYDLCFSIADLYEGRLQGAQVQVVCAIGVPPMRIVEVIPLPNYILTIVAGDGRIGQFDVSPYLKYEAFEDLRQPSEFAKVINGGYFVEQACGADLSADTIEARWQVVKDIIGELAPA